MPQHLLKAGVDLLLPAIAEEIEITIGDAYVRMTSEHRIGIAASPKRKLKLLANTGQLFCQSVVPGIVAE